MYVHDAMYDGASRESRDFFYLFFLGVETEMPGELTANPRVRTKDERGAMRRSSYFLSRREGTRKRDGGPEHATAAACIMQWEGDDQRELRRGGSCERPPSHHDEKVDESGPSGSFGIQGTRRAAELMQGWHFGRR